MEHKDQQGQTPLQVALMRGHVGLVQAWLEEVDAYKSMKHGAPDLRKRGEDWLPSVAETFGTSVLGLQPRQMQETSRDEKLLHSALISHRHAIVQWAPEAKANPEAQFTHQGVAHATPLIMTCIDGSAECVQVLLQAKANPEATLKHMDIHGATALHVANMDGKTDIAKMLLTQVLISRRCQLHRHRRYDALLIAPLTARQIAWRSWRKQVLALRPPTR